VYRHRDVLTLLLPICRHWLLLSDSEKTIGCPPLNIGWKHLLSPESILMGTAIKVFFQQQLVTD
jgi:hypothetical protein